ncbi:hypothetical protein JQC67_09025 [Aurantibacter crassamenti]|uniref:DUF6340 family protein n=1 Tax=Aurantibacter crassamenti TaxID=1837375 RepID=UPI001939C7EA|nr:DUF6340 family protein [Aurantibacter crassamenti]MBM1106276.1 hypothetical protein [Aurantibacter crassamenti]
MKNLLYLAVSFCVLSVSTSCVSTNQLTMNAVQPAPVPIPNDVQNIGIINRSLPSEGHKTIDQIDKILSVEGKNLDKHGAEAAVVALQDELIAEGRFENIVNIENETELQKGVGVLPATLTWSQVEALCDKYAVDVIFSLAYYDTDTKVDYKLTTIEYPNSLGIKLPIPGHEVTLRTLIKNGWRVYDPKSKLILDEYSFNENIVGVGKGINPIEAVKTVINRKEAVVEHSKNIGNAYARRIRPYSRRVTRNYFVKGTDNFVVAKRRAQTGDWDGAAKLWESELNNHDEKVAGRAYYNMAISNEINGDLDKAVEYASKSYSDYRNSEALRYLDILRYRQRQNRELNRQVSK